MTSATLHEPPAPARTADPPPAAELTVEEELYARGYEFDFFQAVSLLERLYPERRPVGREAAPAAEVVRFRAEQGFAFPASAVCAVEPPAGDRPMPELTVAFLGLTGPSGVLPRHYTEALLRRERTGDDPERRALRDWLDLFNHRLISLFFRAWEKYRFTAAYERGEHTNPEPDPFTAVLYSLIGLGQPSLRGRLTVSTRDDHTGLGRERILARVPDLALLRYAGLLSQRPRCAVNLEALLHDCFRLPVAICPFQGQWLPLDPANQTAIGWEGANHQLGVSAVVGARVWDVQSKFRVRLGPLTYAQFLDLIPDRTPAPARKRAFLLGHLTRLYAGPELDAEFQLVLRADEVPDCRLTAEGVGPRLGWNTWVHNCPFDRDAEDAVFASEEPRWL
jgi:type VI secretion system protein ImpH